MKIMTFAFMVMRVHRTMYLSYKEGTVFVNSCVI